MAARAERRRIAGIFGERGVLGFGEVVVVVVVSGRALD
jgi:hypothetical protein